MSESNDTSEGSVEISLQSISGESKTESSTALRLAPIPPKYQFSPDLAPMQYFQYRIEQVIVIPPAGLDWDGMLKNCPHTHKEKRC